MGTGIAEIADGIFRLTTFVPEIAPPAGKLSHSWPRKVSDLPLNVGDAKYDPLFPFGFGLAYTKP